MSSSTSSKRPSGTRVAEPKIKGPEALRDWAGRYDPPRRFSTSSPRVRWGGSRGHSWARCPFRVRAPPSQT
jgi:hypothetical protein